MLTRGVHRVGAHHDAGADARCRERRRCPTKGVKRARFLRATGLAAASALAASLLLAALPGAAQAGGDRSVCDSAGGTGYHPGVGEAGIVCAGTYPIEAGGNNGSYIGYEVAGCPNSSWIGGSNYWPTAGQWNWDYWRESIWILWTGRVQPSPGGGVLEPSGLPGYSSMLVDMYNWALFNSYEVMVWWYCDNQTTSTASALGRAPAPAPITGAPGGDSLQGDASDDTMTGLQGDDRLAGRGGDDIMHAGPGDDTLTAGNGDDQVFARGGDDHAVGGAGSDTILTGSGDDVSRGGQGKDRLFDNHGRDTLWGGTGNDAFSTHDGNRDVIHCGKGKDVVMADRLDRAVGCEHVYRSRRETPK
jgi:Ca2+-binding RTX toxin-like protein